MIDLHSHILPGLDDGPQAETDSVAMGAVAVAAGIDIIAATPHVREDHPFDLGELGARVARMNQALQAAGVALEVATGGEVALSRLLDLDDEMLAALSLGGGGYLLVESPYGNAPEALEAALFDLQVRGLRPMLAHPERCPSFQSDPQRLGQMVQRGVLCSITAGSLAGRFGSRVREFTLALVREELVHDVASDAHDDRRRPPDLREGLDALEAELPGASSRLEWLTVGVPAAILAGDELPPAPAADLRRPSRLRRALSRGHRRPSKPARSAE